jgi:hydroxymethylpyrimidine/phosphomethylpyrimidine kinase
MEGRVLIVAGSDSGGGAGIQGDIKTVTALGSFASTAITALTAQNTRGVFGVMPVEPAFVARQIEVVMNDLGADCIKTGMLFSAAIIDAVVRALEKHAKGIPLVVDPVMIATSGASLLESDARTLLELRLLPIASVITPNAPEAEALTGIPVRDVSDMGRAADVLLTKGASAVLLKGGHLPGDRVYDLLRTADGTERWYDGPRIASRSTHGTGCALASGLAAGLARGLRLEDAVERARTYVAEAIRRAPDLGTGAGPLNHAHPFEPTAN